MMKVAIRRPLLAVAVVLLLTACDDGGPTSPSNRYPQVSGTYTGSLSVTSARFGPGGSVSARMVVVQSGNQLTITGSVSFGGRTAELTAITGTINETGFFTAAGVVSGGLDDPTCGRVTPTTGSLTFSGRTMRVVENASSQYCGEIQISGTLTRTGA